MALMVPTNIAVGPLGISVDLALITEPEGAHRFVESRK